MLFISGARDEIAPPENARRMYEASASSQKTLLVVPGAGHDNTYAVAPQQYESAVFGFLDRALLHGK